MKLSILKFKSDLRKRIGLLFVCLSAPGMSLWRTLYFNFYFLPFKQASHLPIYVYGKLNVMKCNGRITITCSPAEIYRGMIKLNQNVESSGTPGGDMSIAVGEGSEIVFKGKAIIARNSKILLWGGSILTIGHKSVLGLGSDICCSKSITLEDNVRLGSEVKIYDTNFHYTYKKRDMTVRPCNSAIVIGHHCWVGARSTIMKGVVLPPFSTVASNSVVNKNITSDERTLIGGIPARLLSDDFSRIFNPREEWAIYNFFSENPESPCYNLNEPLERYN